MPTSGEDLTVLDGTWRGVKGLRWAGQVTVHVIDDEDRPEVRRLAVHYGYRYHARPALEGREPLREGLGWAGEFVLVVEPGVVLHEDLLLELMPAAADPMVGAVRTPLHVTEGPLVASGGSVTVYRRSALALVGRTQPGRRSEQPVTDFSLAAAGFGTVCLPTDLAEERYPDGLRSYLDQRHSSSSGSLAVAVSGDFRRTRTPVRERVRFLRAAAAALAAAVVTVLLPLLALLAVLYEPVLAAGLALLGWRALRGARLATAHLRSVSRWADLFAVVDRFSGSRATSEQRFASFRRLHALSSGSVVAVLLGGVALRTSTGSPAPAVALLAGVAALTAYQAVRVQLLARGPRPGAVRVPAQRVPAVS